MKRITTIVRKSLLRCLLPATFLPTAQAQVHFFSNANFGGISAAYAQAGSYNLPAGLAGAVSSVRVPPGYQVQVYDQPFLRGNSLTLNANVNNFSLWNDRIRSARVTRTAAPVTPPAAGNGKVRFFENENYTGEAENFGPNKRNFKKLDLRATSLMVPAGYTVFLYDQPNYRGNVLRLAGNTSSLVRFGWNDRARSAKVVASTNPTLPVEPGPVMPPPVSNRPVAYLFMNERFGGQMLALRPGRYAALQLQAMAMNLSSLQISPGYYVRLYDQNRFQGRSVVLSGNVDRLTAIGWNDRTQSIEIARR